MKPTVIFIHGNGGSTCEDHWFPSVKKELERLSLHVISRTFPDNHLARQSYWLPFLKNELKADENTILIGHSSGALAAMRFAEINKIYASVLVAAAYTDLNNPTEKMSGYFDTPWNWDQIKKNQRWILQFASTDDPFIPIEEARYVHQKLQTTYFEYTDQGHFGWDTGRSEFPELIEQLQKNLTLVNK